MDRQDPHELTLEPKLMPLYQTVEGYQEILAKVREGREQYEADVVSHAPGHDKHNSLHHEYWESELQSFTLGIVSRDHPEEIVAKSYLIHAIHFLDDFLDRPDLAPPVEEMITHRNDVHSLLDSLGNVGYFGHEMTHHVPGKEHIVYDGIQRLVYSAIINLTSSQSQREQFLQEHDQIVLHGISGGVLLGGGNYGSVPLLATSKLMDWFCMASETHPNKTLAYLLDLAYVPFLELRDDSRERETGERHTSTDLSHSDMAAMIRVATKHLPAYENGRAKHRLDQLQFLRRGFVKDMPGEVSEAYDELEKVLGAQNDAC
jgi:hypothetical protein